MSRDPETGPVAAPRPDRDPDATQAWIPTFDDHEPLASLEEDGPQWSAESLLPVQQVSDEIAAPSPRAPAAAEEPSALDRLFAEERFEEVAAAPMPLLVGTREVGAKTDAAQPAAPRRPPLTEAQRERLLVAAAAGVLGLLLLAGMFFLGTRLPGLLGGEPRVTVTAAPVPAGTLGPVEPGVHPWTELRGGECLEPYTDPWAEEFTVVDCAVPHTAQLTLHGSYVDVFGLVDESGAPLSPAFPGVDILAGGIDALCSIAVDFAKAGDITDGQMQGAFPTSFDEWEADPSYSCFFSRSFGAPLTGSVAPGAGAVESAEPVDAEG